MDQFVVKFRPLPSATFFYTIKIYNTTLTPLVPPFGNLFPVKDRQREVRRDFIKQCCHLFSVSKASESLEERMISDKKLPKPVDELDSHFKTWHQ